MQQYNLVEGLQALATAPCTALASELPAAIAAFGAHNSGAPDKSTCDGDDAATDAIGLSGNVAAGDDVGDKSGTQECEQQRSTCTAQPHAAERRPLKRAADTDADADAQKQKQAAHGGEVHITGQDVRPESGDSEGAAGT